MTEMGNVTNVSVTRVNGNLIVSLTGEMTDRNLAAITDLIIEKAHRDNVRGAILNFSALTVLDTFTFTAFRNMTEALALMGVRTVWTGLRPGVVSALMDLNIEINTNRLCTAITMEQGLVLLEESSEQPGESECR